MITAIRPIANANAANSLLALGLLFEFPRKLPKTNIIALTQGFEGSEIAFGVSANLLFSMFAVTVLCTLLF